MAFEGDLGEKKWEPLEGIPVPLFPWDDEKISDRHG